MGGALQDPRILRGWPVHTIATTFYDRLLAELLQAAALMEDTGPFYKNLGPVETSGDLPPEVKQLPRGWPPNSTRIIRSAVATFTGINSVVVETLVAEAPCTPKVANLVERIEVAAAQRRVMAQADEVVRALGAGESLEEVLPKLEASLMTARCRPVGGLLTEPGPS